MSVPVTGWLVTGAAGMLGGDLAEVLGGDRSDVQGEDGTAPVFLADRARLDVTDSDAVHRAVLGLGANGVVLNAAGWTDVDGAESAQDQAQAVNGAAVRTLASACRDAGATLVHVSTDYVFGAVTADGGASAQTEPGLTGWAYAEDAPTAPINAYGRTKLDGERAVLETCRDTGYVLRAAWLYGRHGRNFVATVLDLAATRETVDVVDDQVGQPTWTRDLASRMVEVARLRPRPGIYHATAAGEASWYELARAAFAEAGLDPDRVRPVDTAAFPRPAPRPARSVLGHDGWAGTGLAPLGEWRVMLARAFRAGTFSTDPDRARRPRRPRRHDQVT